MAIVWAANFSGNATVNPGTTNQFERRFRLRLDATGNTPGTVTYTLEINPLTSNQASPFGSGTYSLNIGATQVAVNTPFSYDFRNNTQTTLVLRTVTLSTTGTGVTTVGSANAGGTLGSANGSGTYSSPPPVTTYTLSYNANSGSPTPASQTLAANAAFTVGAAPTRTGFTFVRWSGSDGNTYSPGTSASMPASNLTLSAVWAPPTPTGLTVGTRTQTSIQLSWDATPGASGYNLFRNGTSVTSTTATSYTYQTLTAGTTYSLGVVAVSASGGSSSTASINASTVSSNPVYAENAAYPLAKIGLTYAGSVTATNAVSYALAYGNLPPGLTLNTTNGTIGGRPEQRPDGSYFNDTGGTLDSFTFGITATGPTGSTPTTKQFVIRTVFPGERLSTPSRDLIIARRWDGQAWVPVQRVRRFSNGSWIDISTT